MVHVGRKTFVLALTLSIWLAGANAPVAQRAVAVPDFGAWVDDPALLRAKPLDWRVEDLRRDPAKATVSIELFDGDSVRAHLERFRFTRPGGFSWYGSLDATSASNDTGAHGEDYLAIAVQDHAVVGVLHRAGKLFRIRETSTGGLAIYETDSAYAPECGNDHGTLAPAPPGEGSPGPGDVEDPQQPEELRRSLGPLGTSGVPPLVEYIPRCQGATRMDVLVAWTQEAETAAGGAAAIQAIIDLAVVETCVAFRKSEVDMFVNLVMSAKIDYVESGSMATDLGRLRHTSDGFMDEIHGWRDSSGADIVSLFVGDATKCGRSYNMGAPASAAFASSAFNLVSQGCATGYYAFAHELGHNSGLDHDRVNTQNTPSHPYAYGYWPDAHYRTIMGLKLGEVNGTRIQYFSNPNLTYQSLVLGVPDPSPTSADCARALNENASIISSWRQAPSSAQGSGTTPTGGPWAGRLTAQLSGNVAELTLNDPRETIAPGALPYLLVTRRPVPMLNGRPFLRDLGESMVAWRRLPHWEAGTHLRRELFVRDGELHGQVLAFDPLTRRFSVGRPLALRAPE